MLSCFLSRDVRFLVSLMVLELSKANPLATGPPCLVSKYQVLSGCRSDCCLSDVECGCFFLKRFCGTLIVKNTQWEKVSMDEYIWDMSLEFLLLKYINYVLTDPCVETSIAKVIEVDYWEEIKVG